MRFSDRQLKRMKRGLPTKAMNLEANSIGAGYALGEKGLPKEFKEGNVLVSNRCFAR